MLEHFYEDKRTLVDFRRGPLGPQFDSFAQRLKDSGYSRSSARNILRQSCQFNIFLIENGISKVRKITPALADSFLAGYLAHIQSPGSFQVANLDARRALKHLFNYLITVGVMKAPVVKREKTTCSWVLDPYLKYLRGDSTERIAYSRFFEKPKERCDARTDEGVGTVSGRVAQ